MSQYVLSLFFHDLNPSGPPIVNSWNIFTYGFDFVEIFACAQYFVVSMTPRPRSQTLRWKWHRRVQKCFAVIFVLFFALHFKFTVSQNCRHFFIFHIRPRWGIYFHMKILKTILWRTVGVSSNVCTGQGSNWGPLAWSKTLNQYPAVTACFL